MLTGREAGTDGNSAQWHPIRVTLLHDIYIKGFPFLNRMAQHFSAQRRPPNESVGLSRCLRGQSAYQRLPSLCPDRPDCHGKSI